MAIILPSADSRRVVVSYKRKYVHEVLVNRLVKLTQDIRVVSWTDHPDMTIVGDVNHQTKPNKSTEYDIGHAHNKYNIW